MQTVLNKDWTKFLALKLFYHLNSHKVILEQGNIVTKHPPEDLNFFTGWEYNGSLTNGTETISFFDDNGVNWHDYYNEKTNLFILKNEYFGQRHMNFLMKALNNGNICVQNNKLISLVNPEKLYIPEDWEIKNGLLCTKNTIVNLNRSISIYKNNGELW